MASCVILGALALSSGAAHAQTSGTWNNGANDGLWSTPGNWAGGVVPTAGATTTLTFGVTTGTTFFNQNLGAPFILNAITFTNIGSTTAQYTLTGGDLMFAGTSTVAILGTVSTTGALPYTINNNISFTGTLLTLQSDGGNSNGLTVAGTITASSGLVSTLSLAGASTNAGNVLSGQLLTANGSTLNLIKGGGGTWAITSSNNTFNGSVLVNAGTLNFSQANTFNGPITINTGLVSFTSAGNVFGAGIWVNGGTLRTSNSGLINFGNAPLQLGSVSNSNASLQYFGRGAATLTRGINLAGTGVLSILSETDGLLTVTNTLNFTDSSAKVLGLGGAGTQLNEFQSQLIDNGAAATALQKSGASTWIVSNTNNAFTGGITIIAGVLRGVDAQLNLNLANNNLRFSGTSGTVAVLETSGTITAALATGPGQVQFVSGANASGGFSAFGGALNVTFSNDSVTPIMWGGAYSTSTISAVTELQFNSAVANNVVTFNNSLTLSNGNHILRVTDNTTSTNDRAVMTGALSGTGGITKAGTGLLELTGINTFTGGVSINAGTLRGANPAVAFNLSNNNLRFNATAGTVAVLETSGTLSFGLGFAPGQVQFANATGTQGGSGGFSAWGGALNVTITNGTASPLLWSSVTAASGSGGFMTGSGELQFNSIYSDGVVTLHADIDLNGGNRVIRVIDNTLNTTLTSDYAVLSGTLSNGSLLKTGAGLLVLTGNNTFSGGITINQAVLRGANPATNLNIVGAGANNLRFNATAANQAIIETSGSLTNALGTGAGQIQWGPVGTINATTGASGGFSAFGGSLNVTLNNDAVTPLVWNTTSAFVAANGELQFNSVYSDNVVTLNNAIDLGAAGRTIRVNDNVALTTDYAVLAGVLSNGTFTKQGAGTLILTADNSITGATTVAGGTLRVGNGGTSGSLAGIVNVAAGAKVVFNRSDAITRTAGVSGAGAIEIDTPTSVSFNATTSHTGTTTITRGTLRYGVANALTLTTAVVSLNSTGTLDINGFAASIATLTDGPGGGGVITNHGAAGATISLTTSAIVSQFSGTIQDGVSTVALNKNGTGTIILSGDNTFTGTSTATAGTIVIGHDHALGAATWVFSGGTLMSDVSPRTINNSIISFTNGMIVSGTSDLTFSGIVTNSGPRTITVTNTGVTRFNQINLSNNNTGRILTLNVNGPTSITNIGNGGTGAGGLTANFTGGQTLTIAGIGSYTGATIISGSGTMILASGATLGATAITVTNGGTFRTVGTANTANGVLTVAEGGTLIVESSGQINNTAAIALNAGGTMRLDGSIAGGVAVNNSGLLTGIGAAGGTVTLNAGGVLSPGNGGAGQLTLAGLVINGGTLNFELGDPLSALASDSILISTAAAPTFNSGTLNLSALTNFGVGTYTLFSGYSGSMLSSNFTINTGITGFNFALNNLDGALQLVVTGAAGQSLTWSGAIDGVWDETTANWVNGSLAPSTYNNTNRDFITFNDSGLNTTVTLATDFAPGSMSFANATKTYTLQGGAVSGTTGLVLNGTGTVVLANDNTYSGITQINAGTLRIGAGGASGSISNLSAVVNNGVVIFDRSDDVAYDGAISGTGGVVKVGGNTLTIGGASLYTGGLTVNAGTLQTTGTAALPTLGGWTVNSGTLALNSAVNQVTESLTVIGGGRVNISTSSLTAPTVLVNAGTLDLIGGTLTTPVLTVSDGLVTLSGANVTATTVTLGGGLGTTATINIESGRTFSLLGNLVYAATNTTASDPNGAVIQGAGSLSLGASRTITVNDSANAAVDLTISTPIAGAASAFVKNGAGTLYVRGASASTAAHGLSAGTLIIGNDAALGTGVLSVTGGTILADDVSRTIPNAVTLLGALNIAGTSSLQISGTVLNSGNRTINAINAAPSTISVLQLAEGVTNRTLTITGTGSLIINSILSTTSTQGNFLVNGTGVTVTLNNANSYNGNTSVRDGRLMINHADALGTAVAPVTVASTTGNVNPEVWLTSPITLTRDFIVQAGPTSSVTFGAVDGATFAGNITFSQTLNLVNGSFTGSWTAGTTTAGITKTGSGEVTLAGALNYTGPTNILSGTLKLQGADDRLPTGTTLSVAGFSKLDLAGLNQAVATLTGSGIVLNSIASTTSILTVGGGDFQGSIGGSIPAPPGTVALVKTSAATLTINGTSDNLGAVTVSGGQLYVGGSLGVSSAAPVTVSSGATLIAGGWIGGSITVHDGAAFVPLQSATLPAVTSSGSISIGGAGNFATVNIPQLVLNGGTVQFEIADSSFRDRILTGTAPIVNSLTNLSITALPGFGAGSYSLFSGYGTDVIANLSNLSIPTTLGLFSLTLSNDPGALNLIVTLNANNVTWQGAASNVWDATTANWTGDAPTFSNGLSIVTFSNSTATTNVTVEAGGVAPRDMVVNNNSSHHYTFSGGAITSTGTLTKLGDGWLILTNDVTFGGGATIDVASTVSIGDGGATGSFNGDIANAGSLLFNRTGAVTISNVISGNGSVAFSGGGDFTLLSSQTYLGATSIAAGTTLRLGNGGTVGALGNSLVTNDGRLVFDRSNAVTQTLGIAGIGDVLIGDTVAADVTFLGVNSYTGITTVSSSSTLRVGNGGGGGSLVGNIVNNNVVAFNRTGTLVYGGVISGPGAVTLTGGTLTLTADQTYTGGTTVLGGTLNLGGGTAAGSVVGNIANSGTVAFNHSSPYVFDGVISGSGGVTVLTSSVILSQEQFYTGNTVIASGAQLQFADRGILTTAITNTGVLTFSGGFDHRAVISGTGSVLITAGSVVSFSGANTYSGRTTIAAGALLLVGEHGNSGAIVGPVTNTGTLRFARNGSLAYGGVISGPGDVLLTDGGTFTFTGASTYTGGTTIALGTTLQLGNGGTVGSIAGAIVNDGALAFGRTDTVTFTNVINGAGGVAVQTGTVVLGSAASTYSGATTIASGAALQLNDSGSLASASFAVNGLLSLSNAINATYTGALSGTGSFVKDGAANFTLAGNGSAFTGATTVAAGGFIIDGGGIGGTVHLAAGTLLDAHGAIGGTVTSDAGLIRVAGSGVGTLTLGGLVLNGGTLDFDLGGIAASDRLLLTGTAAPSVSALTTLQLFAQGGFGLGTYSLIGGYGTSLISTTDFANLQLNTTTLGGFNLALQNIAGSLNLVVTSSAASNNIVWVGGVSGDWNATTPNWTGDATVFTDGASSVSFTDGATTFAVVVDAAGVQPQHMLVDNTTQTYSFSGGAINALGGLTKQGTGTVVFANDAVFASGVTLVAGTIQVGAGGNTGSLSGNVANSGVVAFNRSDSSTFGGVISGTGAVNVVAGSVTFSAAQTYVGLTTVGDFADLTLAAAASLAGDVRLGNGATLSFFQGTRTFSGAVTGSGGLSLSGNADVTLVNDVAVSGAHTIGFNSTLRIGSGGATGSLSGNVFAFNGGTVVVNRSNAFAYEGIIGGTGGFTQAGSGQTTLSGANIYMGPTSVAAGTLSVAGSIGNSAVTVASGATLNGGGSLGLGGVTILAGGTLAGDLTIAGEVNSGGAINPGASVGTLTMASLVLNGGTLGFELDTFAASDKIVITGSAAPVVNAATAFNFSNLGGLAAGTYNLISYVSGTITNFAQLSGPASLGGFNLTLLNNPGSLDLQVALSGTNVTWQGGDGTWNTTTTNFNGGTTTYTNGDHVTFAATGTDNNITIDAGGVQPGSTLVNNDPASPYTFTGGGVGGLGSLLKAGFGTLSFQNTNTYAGPTTVAAGLLEVATGGSISNTGGVFLNGGALSVQAGGQITGGGQTTVNGGVLTINGAASGTVTANGGTVKGTGTFGALVIGSGAVLSPGNSVGTLTVNGAGVSGGGSLTLNSGADVVFEFKDADGAPGTGWDHIDLGTGVLNLNANNLAQANQITLHVSSWKSDNSGPGGGVGPDYNNFDPLAGNPGNPKPSYFWKFISVDAHNKITTDGAPGSIGGRFLVIDDGLNGVFDGTNPFTRPVSSIGQGTFRVLTGQDLGFGDSQAGLYLVYSAIPEPGSMILAGLASLGAGWYGRRRLRNSRAAAVN